MGGVSDETPTIWNPSLRFFAAGLFILSVSIRPTIEEACQKPATDAKQMRPGAGRSDLHPTGTPPAGYQPVVMSSEDLWAMVERNMGHPLVPAKLGER